MCHKWVLVCEIRQVSACYDDTEMIGQDSDNEQIRTTSEKKLKMDL